MEPAINRKNNRIAAVYDGVILLLLGIWLAGGIPWGGKIFLKHGADPRRAALVIALIGAWVLPFLRERSFVLRITRRAGAALLSARVRWTFLVLACLWASVIGVLQVMALRYPMYDVGIFHQILWSLAHGHGFTSTISGAGSFLRDHLSPSLALLAPFYWLTGSSPVTLGFLTPVLIFSGIGAWVWLAERIQWLAPAIRARVAAATLVFALSFDSLWANMRWGFHETVLGFAALSWGFALHFAESPSQGMLSRPIVRKSLTLLFFLIAAGSKETLCLSVSVFLLVWAFRERRTTGRFAKFLFGLSACLLIAFVVFESIPHPADKNYFQRYYSYLGLGLGDFLKTILFSPGRIIATVGAGELFGYFTTVFLPWLGLPLFWIMLRPRGQKGVPTFWYILALAPSFMSAALATYSPLRESGFHYVLELWPLLACFTILALGRLELTATGSRLKISWIWAFFGLFMLGQDPFGQMKEYGKDAWAEREIRPLFRLIPEAASVVAEEMTGTWLAGRLHVTRWPDLLLIPDRCPEWIVTRRDLPITGGETAWALSRCQAANMNARWAPVWSTQNWIAYQLLKMPL